MKKGKIIGAVLSLCVLGFFGRGLLVSMASYNYDGFRNTRNSQNAIITNGDITESMNTVGSVQQNIDIEEEKLTPDMLAQQLERTPLITLDTPSQVESYLTSNGMSYNKSESDYSSVD